MKLLSCIYIAAVALISVCSAESTNSFAIYLTTGPVDPRITAYGKGDWSDVTSAKTPTISEADIVSYNFTNHLMMLNPEAIKRLPCPSASGTPFVVVANGERIYLGVFMTSISSSSKKVPSIVVDGHLLDTNLPLNSLQISRFYGEPPPTNAPDPRIDGRIRSALEKTQKLR